MHALASLLLSLPLLASASNPHLGSLRRSHWEAARAPAHRRGVTYTLEERFEGQSFFDGFDFYTQPDPTHGQVNYLGADDAFKAGLAVVQADNTTVLAVDSTTTLSSGQNRNSVRIQSKRTWNTGLFIADFYSMPHGCAVWPAYWTVGTTASWPNGGELDIIEGVNEMAGNQITAHTGPTCTLPQLADTPGGHQVSTACTSSPTSNSGCIWSQTANGTYGHNFNVHGGGVYAHTWDASGINVWYFPRGSVPEDIESETPDPASWGQPAAVFANGDECDIGSHFFDHQIVLDITLCGDWTNAVWEQDGCPGSCADFVANPANFKYAKWTIGSIKVYQSS